MAVEVESQRRSHKLPVGQLTIIGLMRLSEPIGLASVYPYLPSMIQSFEGVKPADVGFWTGTVSASFSIAQCLTAISWAKASDRFGRKPILLLGLFNTMVATLLWGFSTNLWMAIVSRSLLGAVNGNQGVVRTMTAEICPWKELQPFAFSLMPIVFSVGNILGPLIGGSLANPFNRPSDDRTDGSLLWKFPYLLPNLVTAVFFFFGIIVGFLFLRESFDVGYHDYGISWGEKIVAFLKDIKARMKSRILSVRGYIPVAESPDSDGSITSGEDSGSEGGKRTKAATHTWAEAFTTQTMIYLATYTLFCLHNTAFDQMISVFMHQARTGPDVVADKMPLRFNKGFGIDTKEIGLLFTLNGVIGMFIQFFVYPPASRKLGLLYSLRLSCIVQSLSYAIIPFTTLIEPSWLRKTVLFAVWLVKCTCATFAFPSANVLLTNAATTMAILTTVNGISTASGAAGRAVGPAITGAAFTWGVEHGYLVMPFFVLAALSFVHVPLLIWAEEGDGPTASLVKQDSESEDEDEQPHADERPDTLARIVSPAKVSRRVSQPRRPSMRSRGSVPYYGMLEDDSGPYRKSRRNKRSVSVDPGHLNRALLAADSDRDEEGTDRSRLLGNHAQSYGSLPNHMSKSLSFSGRYPNRPGNQDGNAAS